MTTTSLARALGLFAVAALGCAPAPPSVSPRASGPLASFSWLAECWRSDDRGKRTEECWMVPRGETMLGMGRTLSGDAVVEWEHTRIEARADGIVFVALPSGQAEATFRLAERHEGSATFENLGHDFPKHVQYETHGAELVARIWGDDPAKAIAWRYVRE